MILTIIFIVGYYITTTKSSNIRKNLELANKYIAYGNYKEAIFKFENVINTDNKNIDAKQSLDILYAYEEVSELVAEDYITKAQEKIDEIKEMPKFYIIKYKIEEIEEGLNGMGNSIQNMVSGGIVAYDKENVYYKYGGINKKNLDSNEVTKISDDCTITYLNTYLNIYNDYIYYTNRIFEDDFENGGGVKYGAEVVRIKKDETNREVIIGSEDKLGSEFIQVIGNNLYYTIDSQLLKTMTLISMNLDTLEKKEILHLKKSGNLLGDRSILIKNPDNTIDMYLNDFFASAGLKVIRDIENGNKEIEDVSHNMLGKVWVLKADKEGVYFVSKHQKNITIYFNSYNSDKFDIYSSTEFIDDNNVGGFILGDSDMYFTDFRHDYGGYKLNDRIYKLNKKGEKQIVRNLFIEDSSGPIISEFYENLYEVKGVLAYYEKNNESAELVIDNDIILKKTKNE